MKYIKLKLPLTLMGKIEIYAARKDVSIEDAVLFLLREVVSPM